MDPLWKHWPSVSKKLRGHKPKLFLFDIDGTLAPLAETPGKAKVSSSVQLLLKRLAKAQGSNVGVLSGRSLKDTKRMIRVPRLIFGGNHGLEIEGPGFRFVHPDAQKKKLWLRQFAQWLPKKLPMPGILIEFKGLTVSIHYRRVQPKALPKLFSFVAQELKPIARRFGFVINRGKKVFEVHPDVNWNKGSAILFVGRHLKPPPLVVYVGDDATDEDAFRVLRSRDVGIRIGTSARSHASYYLRRQFDVKSLLERTLYDIA